MKTKLTLIFLFCISTVFFAQTNDEIAKVYIKKANESMEKIDYKKAKYYFEKSLTYKDTITTSNVAWLGTYIFLELKEYRKARKFARQYFGLKKNKKSEEYSEVLDTFVTIEEKIQELEEIERKNLEKAKRIAAQKRKKDSLVSVWKETVKTDFTLKMDTVFSFNKYGNAVFTSDKNYGLINDFGEVLVESTEYEAVKTAGEFTLLLDKEKDPTKIFAFHHTSNKGFVLPSVTEFNSLSTNYGEVILSTEGKLVAYPNNSLKVFVYDLVTQKEIGNLDTEKIVSDLKKTDKIKKSNKKGQIRVGKEWYYYGGNLGGGMHPLYTEDYKLFGFLSAVGGEVIPTEKISFLGFFEDGVFKAKVKQQSFWIDQKGIPTEKSIEVSSYNGNSKVVKLDEKLHYILRDNKIVKVKKSIEILENYLKVHMN